MDILEYCKSLDNEVASLKYPRSIQTNFLTNYCTTFKLLDQLQLLEINTSFHIHSHERNTLSLEILN